MYSSLQKQLYDAYFVVNLLYMYTENLAVHLILSRFKPHIVCGRGVAREKVINRFLHRQQDNATALKRSSESVDGILDLYKADG